jgi:hypothetical protein
MRGYVQLPEGWERVSADGPGAFVTTEVFRGPDGDEVRWSSRRHRKVSTAARHGASRPSGSEKSVWWRPDRRGWWMAILFVLGSLCFTLGAIASQWARTSRPAIGVTFFVGSIFFTAASYLQYAETVNVEHGIARHKRRQRWRPASWEPRRIDWLAAVVQLIGTLFFNLSTFVALNHNLTTHQTNARVWAPDSLGSIAFLVSSELAFAEVCHRWICFKHRTLAWKIVALNLFGSIAFGASAVASLLEPSSGQPLSARIANAGTSLGALCFLIGALLLMPEAARVESAVRTQPPSPGRAAPVSS